MPPNTLIFLDALRNIAEFKIVDPKELVKKYILP
jgi:hypothetical protein